MKGKKKTFFYFNLIEFSKKFLGLTWKRIDFLPKIDGQNERKIKTVFHDTDRRLENSTRINREQR